MLGWCMVLLAGLVWLPTRAIGTIGLVVIVFQGMFAPLGRALPAAVHQMWEFIYPIGAEVRIGQSGPTVAVLYSLVPWVGVIAAGYAFGAIMMRAPEERRRVCLRVGLSATAPASFRCLNQQKYPASPLFLPMTLGPTIALLPVAERMRGRFASMLETFGRVPMFYYLLHIPLIHATALLVWFLRDGSASNGRFAIAPFVSLPEGQRWGLPLLYLVFVITVAILVVACRWYADVKARRRGEWLRYLWGASPPRLVR